MILPIPIYYQIIISLSILYDVYYYPVRYCTTPPAVLTKLGRRLVFMKYNILKNILYNNKLYK